MKSVLQLLRRPLLHVAALSFFVAEPHAIWTAVAVLALTGIVAGAYPAWIASRAPIAVTLRTETT